MTTKRKTSYWHCNQCNRSMKHGEDRYNCTVCDDFDFCEQCFTTMNPPHPHRMMKELAYGPPRRRKRLPDCMSGGILTAIEMFADRHCMGIRDQDAYTWFTFKTIGDRAKNFGRGLRRLIEPRTYVAICAQNRPEWMITDFACMFEGFISVPIYCLFTNREIAFVINNTRVTTVVCDESMFHRFIKIIPECPSLRHIICMDTMQDIEAIGRHNESSLVTVEPDDILTIIYTSGSSGFPKGAMITERAFRIGFSHWNSIVTTDHINFSYRPLAWAADRCAVIAVLLIGGRTAFSTNDPSRLMEELALVRPSDFCIVPAVCNKIYSEFIATLTLATQNLSPEAVAAEEKRLLEQFSKLIPIRCESILVGGALVSPKVLAFFKRCFTHCLIEESYGITECGGVTSNDIIDEDVQYRLESVPHLGYTLLDEPFPRGELLIKTTQMFSGYINNDDETKAAFTDDGFFRTGDIVELRTDSNDQQHRIHVIDRKKNFFKLAQGQFVSPEHLESIYLQSPFVDQIYIHGDLLSNLVNAVIIPNQDYVQHQSSLNLEQAILTDLHRIGQEESLRPHEIPSQVIIDHERFTPENGLLTSSMKPCRYKLAQHYAHRFDSSLSSQIKEFMQRGGDSLSAIRLSHQIEKELGISVPLDVIFGSPQFYSDAQLDPSFLTSEVKPCRCLPPTSMTILITGTTGFVGAFLLAELLCTYPRDTRFICLVRCTSSEGAQDPMDRIEKTMHFYHLWKEDYRSQIVAMKGDLSKRYFDLDHATYELLSTQVHLIFHCAANVNFVLPYSRLYDANVLATKEILHFALHNTSSTSIPVHYMSTMSVVPSNMERDMSIDKIPVETLHQNGYTQSKWVAERLVDEAMKRCGLSGMIYRLGLITAHSDTGACNPHDLYTLMFSAMMKMKCYPNDDDDQLIGVPVDVTVKNIVELSKRAEQTCHVMKIEYQLTCKEMITGMKECGVQMEKVNMVEWTSRVNKLCEEYDEYVCIKPWLISGRINEPDENTIKNLNPQTLGKDYACHWMKFLLQ
uniref:long-chain-fatty-acid--CoA ligase n=1 Tax=Philodina roseola TaxID=96448 RepID=G3KGX6_PHIRO|nr:long-chain fatty-acid-CoA ligase FadD9 [Philodina roseola]